MKILIPLTEQLNVKLILSFVLILQLYAMC